MAGLEEDGSPFIAATDLIGCLNFAKVRSLDLPCNAGPAHDRGCIGLRRVRDSIVQDVRYGRGHVGA